MCVFANIIGLCTTTGRQEPTGPKTLDSFATANGRECLRRSHRRRGADELYSYRRSMSDGSFGGRHVRRKRDIDGTSVRHHPSGIRLALRLSDHAAASRLVSLFDQAITGRSTMIHDTKAVSTDNDPATSIVSGPREKKSPTPKRALNAKRTAQTGRWKR